MANNFSDLKILIVDDNAQAINILRMVLRGVGVQQIYSAIDGKKAQDFLDSAPELVDLIICDWDMPCMTGLDLLQQVRMTFPDMPFMMLTGSKDIESVKAARKLGVDAYVGKPFSPQELEKKLIALAKKVSGSRSARRGTGGVGGPRATGPRSPPNTAPANWETIMIEPGIVLRDSVTTAEPGIAEVVLVTGSHGGVYAANMAARAGARATIFNDAGRGKDKAGIAGIDTLQELGMAAAAVGHDTARIGDAGDALARGTLSALNDLAAALGCSIGQSCVEAAMSLRAATPPERIPPKATEAVTLLLERPGEPQVWALDSASLVGPEHEGMVLLIGSHGGLPGPDPTAALEVDALAAVFNDAGVGIDDAGVGRLPALDARGIAGATVAAASARIGEGRSTYADGVISRINSAAARLGGRVHMTTMEFVETVLACHKGR